MTRAVLVVDDQPAVAASALHGLLAAGFDARAASSVETALAELAVSRPDAVVLDHHLGDGDAAAPLRHALAALRLPVLVVSGLDSDRAREIAAAHGWPLILKPLTDGPLADAVGNLFTPHGDPMPDRDSPDPRPSLPPSMPPAPAVIAPREEPLPAPPPAPAVATTPSGRPLNVPPVVQAIDRVGDIVACIIIGHLCALGKVSGEVAVLAIGAIVGVGTGLRQVGARAGTGAGVGVVGLLVLGVGRWLAPAAAGAELARASGVFGLVAVLVLGAAGCPKLPPVSGCAPLAQRCDGDRPQVCSPTQRWHYVGDEPCGATPGQSCQVRAGVAGCARGPAAAALGADPCAIECSEECRGALLAKPDCAQEPRR